MNNRRLLSKKASRMRLARAWVSAQLSYWMVQSLLAVALVACMIWLALCVALVLLLALLRARGSSAFLRPEMLFLDSLT